MSVTNARESHAIKKKGCDFQEEIVEKILNKIPSLTVSDVVSCPPSAKGEDAQISNDARKVLPIVVECKHYDKGFGQVYKYYREAHKHMRELGRADNIEPILFIKHQICKAKAVVDADYLISLLAIQADLLEQEV
jgi:hypothetical protein